ncbi:MAG: hypothetical protein Q8S17_00910, partial [Humidesulfovibrio sp.]|nr:hypothetical protein [Humidesulfovibrio sp.]
IYCIFEYCKDDKVDPSEYGICNNFIIPVLMRVNSICNINSLEGISKTKIRLIKKSHEVVEPRPDGDMVKVSASYAFQWPSVEYLGLYDYTPWRTNAQVSEENGFRLSDWGYHVSGIVQDPRRPKVLDGIILSGSDQFGTHHSILMLKMVAYTIASHVRKAKGRRDDMSESIRIWEHDLNKLREKYYDRLRFVL